MPQFSPSSDFLARIRQHDRRSVGLCWLKLPQFPDSGVKLSRSVRDVHDYAFAHPSETLSWGVDEALDYFSVVSDFFANFDSDPSFFSGICPRFKVKLEMNGPYVHLVNVVWNLDDMDIAKPSCPTATCLDFAIADVERKFQRTEMLYEMREDGYSDEEASEELYYALLKVAEEFIADKLASISSIEECPPQLVIRMEMSLASASDAKEEMLCLEDHYDSDDYLSPAEVLLFLQEMSKKLGQSLRFGSAVDMIDEAKRVGATDIAKLAALQSFDDDFRSIPKTRFRMTSADIKAFTRYLGQPVMAQNKVRCSNDHLFLEVTRDLLREEIDSDYPHNMDHFSALHVGATMTDYKRWSSHEGHQFFFALKDDKDVPRIYSDMVSKLGRKFSDMTLPALTSVKGNTTALKLDGVKEMAKLLDKGNRKKIFLEQADLPGGSHDVLFFPDSLYDMTEDEFSWYWRKTGAKVGEATIFFPDALYGYPTQESDIYRYEEYFPTIECVDDIIEQIWPSVLLLTPILPLKGFAQGADHVIRHCLTKGWSTFKVWMAAIVHDDYPVELAFGSAFDVVKLGPIYKHLLRQLKPLFRRYLARVRVVWNGGYQNGYDHRIKTWETWLKKRRFDLKDGTFVDVEVRARMGEMYRLKFYRSSGTTPLTYSLEVPPERATVMVADLAGSYNIGTAKLFGIKDIKYRPVNYADWWKLHNWALAEPIETLNFAVMMTTLNRIRGGLSLGSNVLVDPMLIKDKDVASVALACYMETARRKNILDAIESDENLKKDYVYNITKLGKITGKVLATIVTGGLAIPLYFLAKWILTTHPDIEFVRYPEDPKIVTVHAKGRKRSSPRAILNQPSTLVLPHKQVHNSLSCFVCDMQHSGAFSSTGKADDGQWLVCTNSECDGKVDISMDTTAITDMIGQCRLSEEVHTAMGAVKLVPNIQKFKHWLETNMGGLKHEVSVSHIRGGPGTGKTEIIKAMMHSYEKQGQSTGVLVPFSDLQTDYIETTVLGEVKRVTFDAQTTWYGTKWNKIDVMFIDETTAVRWDLIKALAIHAGTKLIYLVGDALQTKLNAKQGEGIDPTDEQSGLDLSRIPTHELVKNFRLDAWRVKQKNRKYGYKMISVRHDSLPPKFISLEEYKASIASGAIVTKREFVFAHDSAKAIFGKDSVPGDKQKDNMSVRSAQGLTIKGDVAVSASALDKSVIGVHGMLNVADSRSTGQVYFVYHSADTDPVVQELKKELMVTDKDEIDSVWSDPWPTFEKPIVSYDMSDKEKEMNAYVKAKAELGEVDILSDDSEDTLVEQIVKPKRIKMSFDTTVDEMTQDDFSLWSFFRGVFHFCFIDCVEEAGMMNADIRARLLKILGLIYADDVLMGRVGEGVFSRFQRAITIGNERIDKEYSGERLPKSEGKFFLPLIPFAEAMESAGIPVILFRTDSGCPWAGGFPTRVPDIWLKGTSANPLVLNVDQNHVTVRQKQDVECYVRGLACVQNVSELEVVQNGCILAQMKMSAHAVVDVASKKGITPSDFKGKKKLPIVRYRSIEMEGDIHDTTTFVGHKPTFTRVQLPELERRHMNMALQHASPSSSWKEDPIGEVERIHRKTKLRLGTDGYRLASFVDPSGAKLGAAALNEAGPVRGVTTSTNVSVNWDGFIHSRTKTGKLTRKESLPYRSFLPGMGNHYNNTPVESLVAAQRVGRREKKVTLTAEARAYADEVVEKTFREGWLRNYVPNREKCNAKIEEAIRALKSRNYHGRADAEMAKTWTPRLTCSNKDQFKPIKNHKLDLLKGGQVLLQSPPTVNLQFIAWMRVQGLIFKDRMQDDVFTDDYESPAEFRKRFNRAVKTLPNGVQVGIVDGEMWDSQQNEVTRYMEMKFHSLLGAVDGTIREYFQVRGNLKFIMFGIFQGTTNGEKGSGFLDTKLGNTMLQAMVSNQVMRGKGPKVVGIKGDDYIRIQTAVSSDEHEIVKVKRLLGMKLNIEVGIGGEFCGNSVSRAGMYPSITRATIKALAAKAKNYEMFTEQQQAYRDKIEEYQDVGLQECIAYTAFAEKISRNYVEICLTVINSLAHINRKQWEEATARRFNPRYHLCSANGPVLV